MTHSPGSEARRACTCEPLSEFRQSGLCLCLAVFSFTRHFNTKVTMAEEGGIEMLINLLNTPNEHVQRQAAKSLANLGVNVSNKSKIAEAGGIVPLVTLAASPHPGVAVEAVAALANLAVNDDNEVSTLILLYDFLSYNIMISVTSQNLED